MIPSQFENQPASNEAEITLLGANKYGESIVCHIGNGEWVIIDSCVNPNASDKPLTLDYLNAIGVSPEQIKLVICTHWHDDHIKGLSKILDVAVNAEFCISRANDKPKFLTFVGLNARKPINYSTKEFSRCLELLIERGQPYKEAIEDRPLLVREMCSIICLSPSDFTVQNFDMELAGLMKEYGAPTMRIPSSSPNSRSIVVFIKLGNHRAILGADLEVGNNSNGGWIKILSNGNTIDKKSSLFKISHHGSSNAYHSDIWTNLLIDNPIAKLTPWSLGGNILPEETMIDIYKGHTKNLFITELPISRKQKARDPQIEKVIKEFRPGLQEIKYKLGIIRSRIFFDNDDSLWNVENILSAKQLNDE